MAAPAQPSSSTPPPAFRLANNVCYLEGDWSVHALAHPGEIQARRDALAQGKLSMHWDLTRVLRLDITGATLIWQVWQKSLPPQVSMTAQLQEVFDMLIAHAYGPRMLTPPVHERFRFLITLGRTILSIGQAGKNLLSLLGQLILDFGTLLRQPAYIPWREISAQIYRMGAQALGITALVGFLIGIVLSYLSSQQLQTFGADKFIVRLLGVSIVRELGPMLAAILVAGRSGSAITAQLGVMHMTQELDAMHVMGISLSLRLILPRVVALAIAMPLLVIWTDAMALIGGMLAAREQLGIPFEWFLESLPDAINLTNYGIGLAKGVTFGVIIALVACHFGLIIAPNTESLGRYTTTSVVAAITCVISVDAIYAILLSKVPL